MLSAPWSWLLTVVFVATAAYCAWHWFNRDRPDPSGERMIDVNHALMSVLMVVMIWRQAGTPGTILQVVVFTAFALALGVIAARSGDRLIRISAVAHGLLNLAMVWMLVAMPLLMGHPHSAGGDGDHGGHGGHAGTESAPVAALPTPAWADGINLAAIVVLALAGAWWVWQILTRREHRLHSGCHLLMSTGMAAMLAVM